MRKHLLFITIAISQLLFARPPSVVDIDYKWDKPSIRVCWSDDIKYLGNKNLNEILNEEEELIYFKNSDRAFVQKTIQEAYQKAQVGIEFVGWQDCGDEKDFDIALVGTLENPMVRPEESYIPRGVSRIARKAKSGQIADTLDKGYIFLNKQSSTAELTITTEQNLKLSAIHEFGHAAGLRHEHIRAEADLDINCKKHLSEEEFTDIHAERAVKAKMIGPYDEKSIMNYCYERKLSLAGAVTDDEIKLSAGDIHSLRCMYLPDLEPAGSCEQTSFYKSEIKID